MHVGPHGEGEREVLLRLVCGLLGAAPGVAFIGTVASNFGGHPTLVRLAALYVGIVLATVFLPETSLILARSRR
jgi:hypothetical protein